MRKKIVFSIFLLIFVFCTGSVFAANITNTIGSQLNPGSTGGYFVAASIIASDSGTLLSLGINVRIADNFSLCLFNTYNSGTTIYSGIIARTGDTKATLTGWKDISVSATSLVKGTTYYIAFLTNDTLANAYYDTSANERYYSRIYNNGLFTDPSAASTNENAVRNLRIIFSNGSAIIINGLYTESSSFNSIKTEAIRKSSIFTENQQYLAQKSLSVSEGAKYSESVSFQASRIIGTISLSSVLSGNFAFIGSKGTFLNLFDSYLSNFLFGYNGSRATFSLFNIPSGESTTVIINISNDLTILFIILIALNLLLILIKIPILGIIVACISISLGALSMNNGVNNPYLCLFVVLMGLINILLNALDMRK